MAISNPPEYLRELIEVAFRIESNDWKKPDCGLSPAYRYAVQLENGNKIFVKAATDKQTEIYLRNEYCVLSSMNEKFMPRVIDWLEKPDAYPVLITQDLSDAYWPASHQGVTWRNGDIDLLLKEIYQLSGKEGIPALPALTNEEYSIWTFIASNPRNFLQLNLCTEKWFNNAISHLIEAEKQLDKSGSSLVHGDIRSDNICFAGSQVMFVDWSNAARGNSRHDLANLLPTLYLEGGPTPFEIMADGESEASSLCATHIRRLGKDSTMPGWLRKVFRKLIAIELEWAADCLKIDKPDGINWQLI
jgi:hypothetical protein